VEGVEGVEGVSSPYSCNAARHLFVSLALKTTARD
jgi:hypothetical protein